MGGVSHEAVQQLKADVKDSEHENPEHIGSRSAVRPLFSVIHTGKIGHSRSLVSTSDILSAACNKVLLPKNAYLFALNPEVKLFGKESVAPLFRS
jgi:hypothetical protein